MGLKYNVTNRYYCLLVLNILYVVIANTHDVYSISLDTCDNRKLWATYQPLHDISFKAIYTLDCLD